jgi:hypothetical protein
MALSCFRKEWAKESPARESRGASCWASQSVASLMMQFMRREDNLHRAESEGGFMLDALAR